MMKSYKIEIKARTQKEYLIVFRDANQRFLLQLHSSGNKIRELNELELIKTYNLLIGAGFSLWRAAFLSTSERNMNEVLNEGIEVLDQLIRDNSFNYPQETRFRNWVVGFYLNNAKYRTLAIEKKLTKLGINHKIDFTPVEDISLVDQQDMNKAWTYIHNVLIEVWDMLSANFQISQDLQP